MQKREYKEDEIFFSYKSDCKHSTPGSVEPLASDCPPPFFPFFYFAFQRAVECYASPNSEKAILYRKEKEEGGDQTTWGAQRVNIGAQ